MGLIKRDTSHLNKDTSQTLDKAKGSCGTCGLPIPATDVFCRTHE